jgi:ribonuclease BN (tRNA processing enzyme)
MGQVELVFLGSGDAFGSGGRFQTCILVRGGGTQVLLDCGASSLIAMKRGGVQLGDIGMVLLTHLHGDHFGGLPFLILDAQFSRRQQPLVVAGPPGVATRVEASMENLFPNSSKTQRRFALEFVELFERQRREMGEVSVTPFAVEHFSGAPSFALRVEYGDKVVVYSGDTEWTENLIRAAAGSDLFICEAYYFEKKIRYHLDYRTLREHLGHISSKRTILTHMSDDMLKRAGDLGHEMAHDGMIVTLS